MTRGVRRIVGAVVATLLATAVLVAVAEPAYAFDLKTDYPVVRVGPGENAEMTLEVTSTRVERVALTVPEAPPGWRVRLTGGGFEIGAVYTDPDEPPSVTLEVATPPNVERGVHRVVVRGDSGGQVVNLPVEFHVADDVTGAFTLTSDFTQLRGGATDTFRFDLTLESSSPRQASFALAAAGPENWTVTARPSAQTQASTVSIDPGGTATIQVEANPPDDVEAGTYPVLVRAEGAGTTVEAELEVEIVGSFTLEFNTANERLDASGGAGRRTSVPLVVRNTGTAPLQGVTLSATPPSGWDVTFSPSTVEVIPPGEEVAVTARIRPDGDAVAGDYAVTIRASGGGQDKSLDLRFAVETSGWWGFLGLLVIAVAIAALLWVFRRYGRR